MKDLQNEFIKEIVPEDLPEEFQSLVEIIGMEATLSVMTHFAGMSIYVPFMKRLIQPIRDKHIRSEFTGFNHAELARKYKVTSVQIRNILKAKVTGQ